MEGFKVPLGERVWFIRRLWIVSAHCYRDGEAEYEIALLDESIQSTATIPRAEMEDAFARGVEPRFGTYDLTDSVS